MGELKRKMSEKEQRPWFLLHELESREQAYSTLREENALEMHAPWIEYDDR
jgi:hypothetical protein